MDDRRHELRRADDHLCVKEGDWGMLHEWMKNQTDLAKKILDQVSKTNGRVNRLEQLYDRMRWVFYTAIVCMAIFTLMLFPHSPLGALLLKLAG